MPIRFRCEACGQLMGISSRRAGAEVSCPKCGKNARVPQPDPNRLFEGDDIDDLLRPDAPRPPSDVHTSARLSGMQPELPPAPKTTSVGWLTLLTAVAAAAFATGYFVGRASVS